MSGDIPPARQCTMPTCENEALNPTAEGSLCAEHHTQVAGDEMAAEGHDGDLDATTIREHYERARPALDAVGALDDAGDVQSLGNYDYYGWYETRPETSVDAIEAGHEMRGRVFGLVDDYSLVAQNLQRVLYSTISYTETDAITWQPYQETDGGKDWRNDHTPTPDYNDLGGYALFADIDLADEHKERPLPDEKQAIVEQTIDKYLDAFAQLAGDRDSVFALDSVGGAYVFISPQATAPIAAYYDDDDRREKVYEALAGRVNEWLSDVRDHVNDQIPQAEGMFEPDFLNNKNRLYKAPLSIHKSINGLVHPLDVEAADYEFVPVQESDAELVSDVEAWGEAFTDASHQTALDAIIATLWGDYDEEGWQAILDAWLADERERKRNRLHERAKREKRQRDRRQELTEALDDADEATIDETIANQTVTPVKQDVFDAIDQIDIRTVVRSHAAAAWDTSNRSNETTFDPSWRTSGSGMSCAIPDNANTFIDNGCNAKVGPVKAFALGERILSQTPDAAARSLDGQDYWEAVRQMRQRGFSIPVHIPAAGDDYDQTPYWAIVKAAVALGVCEASDLTERGGSDGSTYRALPGDDGETFEATLEALDAANIDHGRDLDTERSTRQYGPETCTSPGIARQDYVKEQRWDAFQGERYQAWLDRNRAEIWGDDAGSGKTTNAAIAAARRERPHTVLFDKHEKAHEFIEDAATPDDYFWLKGGEQPVHDCCMDATSEAAEDATPECPTHGHPAEWPRMNPIYERDEEDELRQRYEALVGGVGPRQALVILDEDGDLLDNNPWIDQFDGLEHRDRVVGVHEYQTLKTAVGDRDLILDETPRLLAEGQRVTVDGLTRTQLRLEDLADIHATDEHLGENFRALADFAVDLREAIASEDDVALAELDRPAFSWESFFEMKDPMSGAGVNRILRAETLAQLKIIYNEGLVTRIREGEWNSEPFCMDTLLAAAAEAGIDDTAARRAIAVPSTLDDCPWCGGELASDNGVRVCTDGSCGWHEANNTIVPRGSDPARAVAWLETDVSALENKQPALVTKLLPPASDFPTPLDLDATATPSKVAAMYGEEEVTVTGDEPLDLSGQLNTTQIVDGQYHAKTITDTPSLQDRIQGTIDTAGEVHDTPLFGVRSDLIPLFNFPENGKVLTYHAARGLNRAECDAVICIGAPHPNVEDLKRDAELLAMDRDDIRVGGKEHSTRQNAPNPPVYRKLLYEDEDGQGVAIPTKHYTGLTGELFRESREKELEQFVHRIRPLLADGEKDAYLLTNVPTDIPIDTVVDFEELTGDLSAVFPVPDGAMRLLGYGRDALEGDGPDGFRATTLVEQEDDEISNHVAGWHRLAQLNGEEVTQRTVRNWVDALEAVGLLVPGEYEQRAGVAYTADLSTSKRALQVISSNVGFEVAALRGFAQKVRSSDGSLDWLAWAERVLSLGGDHCEWGPPPAPDG